MQLRRVQEIQDAIARVTGFVSQLERSADGDLRAQAHEHAQLLDGLPDALTALLVDEGKPALLMRSPEAEILRTPTNGHNAFSCVPIFMIGNRRSGTTLLACLLNSAPGLIALPETFLAGNLVGIDPLFRLGHVAMMRLGEAYPTYLQRLGHLIDTLYGNYASQHGKRRWVSKELFVAHRLDLLDAVFDYRAQFLYVVRHGLSVAASCAQRFPMRDGLPLNGRTSLDVETYLDEWLQHNGSLMDFYERNRDRCLFVRYEELTQQPLIVGGRVFAFIQEPWSDDLVNHGLAEQDPQGLGDANIVATGGRIHAAKEPWQHWPAPLLRTLGRKANPMLERLGYQPVG